MSSLGGPNTVTSGLVLSLDAGNVKSIPPQPKNLYSDSQNFTSSLWLKSKTTAVTSTTLAPYGDTFSNIITATSTSNILRQSIILPQGVYTVSYYIKYINFQYFSIVHEGSPYGTALFDIINGTKGSIGGTSGFVVGSSIESVGNGYYRISASFNITTSNFTLSASLWFGGYNGNNNSGSQVYAWGAQLERSSAPTTYSSNIGTLPTLTTWKNINSTTNSGSLVNGPIFNPTNGGSIAFDGTNDYSIINSPSFNPVGTSDFTISVWVKLSSLPISNPRILCQGVDANNYYNLSTYGGNSPGTYDSFWFEVKKGGTYYGTNFNTADENKYKIDVWYNLVGTFNNTTNTVLFYVNNVIRTGSGVASGVSSPLNSILIANNNTSSVLSLPGSISNIQIYNRALSASEILQNYNATKSKYNL